MKENMTSFSKNFLVLAGIAVIIATLFMAESIILFIVAAMSGAYALVIARSMRRDNSPVDLAFLQEAHERLENSDSYAEWQDIIDRVAAFAFYYRHVNANRLPAEECEAVELARQILRDAQEEDRILMGPALKA